MTKKTLKDILGEGYLDDMQTPDTVAFVAKHKVDNEPVKKDKKVGTDNDEVFKASNVKTSKRSPHHGHEPEKSKEVYEAVSHFTKEMHSKLANMNAKGRRDHYNKLINFAQRADEKDMREKAIKAAKELKRKYMSEEATQVSEENDDGWYAHNEMHGSKGISKEDWKKGWRLNSKGERVQTKKANEEIEVLDETHRVSVTYSDPNSSSVSARKEKMFKNVNVKADSENDAISKAKKHFKSKGYRVHDAEITTMKEEVEQVEETVSVSKKKYSWGQMMVVRHGASHSFPLHPEHQEKIKNLKDGEKTSFTDETKRNVVAARNGNNIILSHKGASQGTVVNRSHFTEEVKIDEAVMPKFHHEGPKGATHIKKDSETGEHVVRFWKKTDGGYKRHEAADYFTDDKEDAHNTAKKMVSEQVEAVDEKTLTPPEMKKRKEIADAIKREHPEYSDEKKMKIATAQAIKVAETSMDSYLAAISSVNPNRPFEIQEFKNPGFGGKNDPYQGKGMQASMNPKSIPKELRVAPTVKSAAPKTSSTPAKPATTPAPTSSTTAPKATPDVAAPIPKAKPDVAAPAPKANTAEPASADTKPKSPMPISGMQGSYTVPPNAKGTPLDKVAAPGTILKRTEGEITAEKPSPMGVMTDLAGKAALVRRARNNPAPQTPASTQKTDNEKAQTPASTQKTDREQSSDSDSTGQKNSINYFRLKKVTGIRGNTSGNVAGWLTPGSQKIITKTQKRREPVTSGVIYNAGEVKEQNVWDKPSPDKESKKLTPAEKAKAKARAKAAGRPYPNLVDNMVVAKEEIENKEEAMINEALKTPAQRVGHYHTEINKLLKGIATGLHQMKKDAMSHKNYKGEVGPHWGHAATFSDYHKRLSDLHDQIHQQGEYMKPVNMKEEIEQIDELDLETYKSYHKKSGESEAKLKGELNKKFTKNAFKKYVNRRRGQETAVVRAGKKVMATEDIISLVKDIKNKKAKKISDEAMQKKEQ